MLKGLCFRTVFSTLLSTTGEISELSNVSPQEIYLPLKRWRRNIIFQDVIGVTYTFGDA